MSAESIVLRACRDGGLENFSVRANWEKPVNLVQMATVLDSRPKRRDPSRMSEDAEDEPAQHAEGAPDAKHAKHAEASFAVDASPPPLAAAPVMRGKPLEEWAVAAVIMTIIGAMFWLFFSLFRG